MSFTVSGSKKEKDILYLHYIKYDRIRWAHSIGQKINAQKFLATNPDGNR
jgi:hypothetical protein